MEENNTALQLKEFTKISHQQLEKVMVADMKQIKTDAHYIELLRTFYSFFAGLEAEIDQFIDQDNLPDYLQRRKSELLIDDLKTLGAPLPQIASGEDLPKIKNSLQAFGALYVMEGSTIGGKFIAKMIKDQLQNPDFKAVKFFEGYGEQTSHMWEEFKKSLNKSTHNQAETEVLLVAGNETFAKFKTWFDSNH